MSKVAINGNTYPVKDQLKDMGGTWDANRKVWMVPIARAEEARKLVANAPKSEYKSNKNNYWKSEQSRVYGSGRYGRLVKCRECGMNKAPGDPCGEPCD